MNYWGYLKYNVVAFGTGIPAYIIVMFGAHAALGLSGGWLACLCLATFVVVALLAMTILYRHDMKAVGTKERSD